MSCGASIQGVDMLTDGRPGQTEATIEEDDRGQSLQHILARRSSSLVGELLAIQQHAEPVEKCREWAANPLCLRYRQSSPTTLELKANPDLKEGFVAVSWTWDAADHEDRSTGKYSVTHAGPGESQTSSVRNTVLDRVIDYLQHTGLDLFWIDRACVDQANATQKYKAINSMDLIYREAAKSVGLLTTPIRTEKGLHLVENLLNGESCHSLKRRRNYLDTINTIEILHDLTKDQWWHRAWVFQEEYVAGQHMDLMIPLAKSVQPYDSDLVVGSELIIKCIEFRRQATDFLMTYLDTGWRLYRSSCEDMLGIVGRYNLLLPDNSDGIGSMLGRIVEDVGKRGVRQPWDSLAIIANTCGYETRLKARNLITENRSLSVSLIAQFLLNGECFGIGVGNGSTNADALDKELATFLHKISVRENLLPAEPQQLTFFKNCRLPWVSFSPRGLHTLGLIWELPARNNIRTSTFKRINARRSSIPGPYSEVWEAEELDVLILELDQGHQSLARKLCDYVEKRRAGITSVSVQYMDRMLWRLVQATREGYVLRVGYLERGGAGAIFIPNRDDVSENIHVFTAWQHGHSKIHGLDNFVSLKVGWGRNRAVRSLGWLDGLAFYSGQEPYPVTFEWPAEWQKQM